MYKFVSFLFLIIVKKILCNNYKKKFYEIDFLIDIIIILC